MLVRVVSELSRILLVYKSVLHQSEKFFTRFLLCAETTEHAGCNGY